MREPVRFAEGLAQVMSGPAPVLVELGPGQALSTLARPQANARVAVVATVRHAREQREDAEVLLEALGQVWLAGVPVDWMRVHAGAQRQRVLLPTYPFQRQRFWIESQRRMQPIAVLDEAGQVAQEEPHHPRPGLTTEYVAPADDVQKTLVDIWQELLGVEPIGIYDNFFELGGHSLLMIQVRIKLEKHFQREVSVADLFKYPTVNALAKFFDQLLAEDEPATPTPQRVRTRGVAVDQQRQSRLERRAFKKSVEGQDE
jgi:acyl carrier protein